MQTDISLPVYVPEQVQLYQGEHLLAHEVCPFDVQEAVDALQRRQDVLAIDIGGDKIRCATYRVVQGSFEKRDERTLQSKGGAGYLEFLERLAAEAIEQDLQVGISSATKMTGSVIDRTVNLPVFFEEISARHGADYERVFPGRSVVVNDTIAGICGATTRIALSGAKLRDVAFFICGSGLGASVITDGTAIHVEAAHVPLVAALNPLGQTTRCGVEGRNFVCVDRVVAGRAGIEDIYHQRTDESLDGVALGRMYEDGDPLATTLYETSALTLAHAIAGVMRRYSFADDPEGSAVVLHGGTFEITRYRDAVQCHLAAIPHPRCRVVFSRDLAGNVCLDGAAVLAAMQRSPRG